jgi:hypothetical protein
MPAKAGTPTGAFLPAQLSWRMFAVYAEYIDEARPASGLQYRPKLIALLRLNGFGAKMTVVAELPVVVVGHLCLKF